MSTEQHILACIDGSAVTESVCSYAAWYASRLDLSVGLLHATDIPASTRRDLSGAIGIDSRQLLLGELTQLDEKRAQVVNSYSNALIQDAKSYINSRFDVNVDSYQRRSKLLPAIEHFKEKNRAIVMGRRGEDHKNNRINIGSQIETVARASSIPILICSEQFKVPTSFMVAFDASKVAIKAVQMVANSPLLRGMQGHIVMIGNDDDSSKKILAAAVEQLKSSGFMVDAHLLSAADAVDGLLTFQVENEIDIIVVGAYGGSKWRQLFLGSATTEIIVSTLSPIILVH
ncbi:universal stress protein [Psychrobacter frigidicola]|uniref:universal stress protein n=1 Tax=Psychrobacter frigidicola TaxID=45611 RepID=UPI0019196FA7|nr:universal stress protein [Psychrobacter frigidicola]